MACGQDRGSGRCTCGPLLVLGFMGSRNTSGQLFERSNEHILLWRLRISVKYPMASILERRREKVIKTITLRVFCRVSYSLETWYFWSTLECRNSYTDHKYKNFSLIFLDGKLLFGGAQKQKRNLPAFSYKLGEVYKIFLLTFEND